MPITRLCVTVMSASQDQVVKKVRQVSFIHLFILFYLHDHNNSIYIYLYSIIGICPKGDDPLTPFVTYPSISIRTTYRLQKSIDVPNLTKKYSSNGYFRITFQNESLFVPIYQYQGSVDTSEIQLPINGSKCNSLFESNWKNVIKQVNCVPTLNSDGVTYVITFLSFPAYSHENNIYYISPDGRLDISQFFCEPFMVTGLSNGVGIVDNKASCTVIDTTPSNMAIPGIN